MIEINLEGWKTTLKIRLHEFGSAKTSIAIDSYKRV